MNEPDVSRISIQFLLKEPFYGHFLLGVPKAFETGIETAAVRLMPSQLVKLLINPEFWQSLSEEHRYGLLKHEVLHIVLKHLTRQKEFSHKKLFNIAADLVVNQYILPGQLPEGALCLERFWHLEPLYGIRLEANREADYYYRELSKMLHASPNPDVSLEALAAGRPAPVDLDQLLQEGGPEMEKHTFWPEFDALSPGEASVLEHQIRNVTRQAWERVRHKSRGTLPAGLIEQLQALMAYDKPQVNWRRIIRLFAASSTSTYLKNTIRRPSKRYQTTPGIQLKRSHRLMVAIDTSGSIQQAELAAFMTEIHHIWRQGAQVHIVECDAQIQRHYPYKGRLPESVMGRGGTDFNPVIRLANQEKPDALIYFTDGYAPQPEKISHPVLWVISANGTPSYTHLPGRIVQLVL